MRPTASGTSRGRTLRRALRPAVSIRPPRWGLRDEHQGDRVHAMACVPRGESLAHEHVAEVATAPVADDLGPLPVPVRDPADRSGDLLVEAGPSTARVELVVRPVELRPAAFAAVRPCGRVMLILARERRLGPFAHDDALLGSSQLPPPNGFGHGRVDLSRGPVRKKQTGPVSGGAAGVDRSTVRSVEEPGRLPATKRALGGNRRGLRHPYPSCDGPLQPPEPPTPSLVPNRSG